MKIPGFLCFIWKKCRKQKTFQIFGHFSAISEKFRPKIIPRFVRPLTLLLGPFWIMRLKNRPAGNTEYDVPLPGLLELMVGVHVVLPDGGQLSLDGKGRLLHLCSVHLTLHKREVEERYRTGRLCSFNFNPTLSIKNFIIVKNLKT